MVKTSKIRKALIPAAGFGTRFLPASKVIPKVMFPIIDKPIIQIVVEELVKGGITNITFVLKPHTQAVKDHFRPFPALNLILQKSGKDEEIEKLKKIEKMADFHFVEQIPDRHGSGAAILSAKKIIGDEPFLLHWADEFFLAKPPVAQQLMNIYRQYKGVVMGCVKTKKPEDGARFGFVVGKKVAKSVTKISSIIEKPGVGKAPSQLASLSGIVMLPEIFAYLEKANREVDKKRELYYIDGLKLMLADGFPFYALEYQNYKYYDTGDRFGYLKTMVELGLESKEFGESLKKYLRSLRL